MSQLGNGYPMGDPMGASLQQAPQAMPPQAPPPAQAPQQPPQGPPQQQAPPPPPPEPLSQAETMNLQRYQQGSAYADTQLASGEINQATAAQQKQELSALMTPLKQRQEAAAKAAKAVQAQEQKEALTQQEALKESIQQMNMMWQASVFPKTIGKVVDAATGLVEHFYPQSDRNGSITWKPIEWLAHHKQQDLMQKDREMMMGGGGGGGGGGDGGGGEEQNALEQSAAMAPGSPPGAAGDIANLPANPEQLKVAPKPDEIPGEFEAPKPSGFQPPPTQGQILSSGSSAPGGSGQYGAALTPEQHNQRTIQKEAEAAKVKAEADATAPIAEFYRRAQQAIPQPQSTGNPILDAHAQAQWRQEVNGVVHQQMAAHTGRIQHREALAAHKEIELAKEENAKALMKQKGQQIADERRIEAQEKAKAAAEKAQVKEEESIRGYLKDVKKEHADLTAGMLPGSQKIQDFYKERPDLDPKNHKATALALHNEFKEAVGGKGIGGQAPPAPVDQHQAAMGLIKELTNPGNLPGQTAVADKDLDAHSGVPANKLASVKDLISQRMEAIPFGERYKGMTAFLNPLGEGGTNPYARLKGMHGILSRAKEGKLSLRDKLEYQKMQNELDKVLREHGAGEASAYSLD